MSVHRKNFHPHVEALEGRWVPATTVTVSPTGGMTVTGDAGNNQIAVFDNGSAGNGNITVVADGVTHAFPNQHVVNVRVVAGDGNDFVTYNLTSVLQFSVRPRTILVNLGTGDNAFKAHLEGGVTTNATLQMFAIGLNGHDDIELDASDITGVGPGGTLRFKAWGLAGEDDLRADLRGLLLGTADVELFGGPDNDDVEMTASLDGSSTGQLTAAVNGRDGDDFLELFVFTHGSGATVNAQIDGGNGFDRAWSTDNVQQVNVENGHTL